MPECAVTSTDQPDAASTPIYTEKDMAITTNQIYDVSRDVYLERERYEREMQLYRMKEEDYRRQQQMYAQQGFGHIQGEQAIFGQMSQEQVQKPKHDPKSPLAFLNKPDNKLLLTGEAL